jgi:hypothetical protein
VRLAAVIASFWFVLTAASPSAQSFTSIQLDQATKDYLEGVWLAGHEPREGPCATSKYVHTQMEFEFEKSGGRAMYYRPYDSFANMVIASATRSGNDIWLTLAGSPSDKRLRLHVLASDRVEIYGPSSSDKSDADADEGVTLYKCGGPDHSVNQSVPTSELRILTSNLPELVSFLEVVPGLTDEEICLARRKDPKAPTDSFRGNHWLQFEAFGPVHYFVMGNIGDKAWSSKLDLAPIHSIVSVSKNSLQLIILERIAGDGSWLGGTVKPYTMDVVWDGRQIFIPQMNKSFVRCSMDSHRVASPAPLPLQ